MKLNDGTEIDIYTDDLISTSMMRELGWGRLVEQELRTFVEHLNSPPCFCWGWSYSILSVCVVLCRSLFYIFRLVITLSVLLFTASDYPFDKRFFHWNGPPARCCAAHWNICCKLSFLCKNPGILQSRGPSLRPTLVLLIRLTPLNDR